MVARNVGGPVGLGAPRRAGRAQREAQGPRRAYCARSWAQVRTQLARCGACGSAFGRPARRSAPTATAKPVQL